MAMYVYINDIKEFVVNENGELVWGVGADALYEIKLPSLPISDSDNKPPSQTDKIRLSPILEIPNASYPSNMGCVQFGSKLYFFGGYGHGPMGLFPNDPQVLDHDYYLESDTTDEPYDLTDRVYSRNVYVWDTNDASSGLKECPFMATGKPSPSAFVAHGMIYVIAGSVERGAFRLSNDSIKHFERFNPAEETWQALDDSPLQNILFCIYTTVFENHHKVVIFGFKCESVIRLVYDFEHDKWDSVLNICEPPRYTICHVSDELRDGGHYLYGLPCLLPNAPIKLGPLKDLDHLLKLCTAKLSVAETPVTWNAQVDWRGVAFNRLMGFRPASRLYYLGDGYFCHVMGGRECFIPEHDPNCQHRCNVSVVIFKELSSQVQGEQEVHIPLSFEAKLLHIEDYLIQLPSHLCSQIRGLFCVEPGNSILDQSMRVHKEECKFMLSSSEDDQRLLSTSILGRELTERICTKSKVAFGSQGLEKKGLQLLV